MGSMFLLGNQYSGSKSDPTQATFSLFDAGLLKIVAKHYMRNDVTNGSGRVAHVFNRNSITYFPSFIRMKGERFIDNYFPDRNPRSLANVQLVKSGFGLRIKEYDAPNTNYCSYSSNTIKCSCDTYLPFPISLLILVPLIIFGGWLNSYGIDRGSALLALVGWLIFVVCGSLAAVCSIFMTFPY